MPPDGLFMFGGDPEAFLIDTDGRPAPAHLMGLPPVATKLKMANGEIFRDGYAVEFNPLPSATPDQLGVNFNKLVFSLLHRWRANGGVGKGVRVVPTPWVRIDLQKDVWDGPLDLRQFGCTPSLCAYSGKEKKLDISATTFPFRSAGGHVHLTTPLHFKESPLINQESHPWLVKLWDLYVQVPLTFLLEEGRTRPFRRRRLYGSAGEYRVQTHGMWKGLEYRVLGPELWFHDAALLFTLRRMAWVVKNFASLMEKFSEERSEMAKEYINFGTRALATQLVENDQPFFKPSIRMDWGRPDLSLRV